MHGYLNYIFIIGSNIPAALFEPVHFAEKSWLKVLFADLL
jgi:hypothetical protein